MSKFPSRASGAVRLAICFFVCWFGAVHWTRAMHAITPAPFDDATRTRTRSVCSSVCVCVLWWWCGTWLAYITYNITDILPTVFYFICMKYSQMLIIMQHHTDSCAWLLLLSVSSCIVWISTQYLRTLGIERIGTDFYIHVADKLFVYLIIRIDPFINVYNICWIHCFFPGTVGSS